MKIRMCPRCKKALSVAKFAKYSKGKDGCHTYCKKCMKQRNIEYYKNNKKRMQQRNVEYYKNNRQAQDERCKKNRIKYKKLVDTYKEEYGCKYCTMSEAYCLEFHHRNSISKETSVSNLLRRRNIKKVWEEIKKCDIVCCNCHRKIHGHGLDTFLVQLAGDNK